MRLLDQLRVYVGASPHGARTVDEHINAMTNVELLQHIEGHLEERLEALERINDDALRGLKYRRT